MSFFQELKEQSEAFGLQDKVIGQWILEQQKHEREERQTESEERQRQIEKEREEKQAEKEERQAQAEREKEINLAAPRPSSTTSPSLQRREYKPSSTRCQSISSTTTWKRLSCC